MITPGTAVETWRDIPGFEGRYQASDLGRVRSLDCYVRCGHGGSGQRLVAGRILRPAAGSNTKHLSVVLGRGNTRGVHACVALAFFGLPPPRHEVLHLDHDPTNNRLANLRYGTRSENIKMDWAAGVRRYHPNFNRWGYRV